MESKNTDKNEVIQQIMEVWMPISKRFTILQSHLLQNLRKKPNRSFNKRSKIKKIFISISEKVDLSISSNESNFNNKRSRQNQSQNFLFITILIGYVNENPQTFELK
jgi:hypothetical protein